MDCARSAAFLTAIAVFCLLVYGCGRNEGMSPKVLASINDYDMTVEDFMYESKDILKYGATTGSFPLDSEEVLDALIDKEVLLQEAQRQGFDKREAFMRTIEDYWEQTLLRDLMNKKAQEISFKTVVYEDEVMNYYGRMKTEKYAFVIVLKSEKAATALSESQGDVTPLLEQAGIKEDVAYIIPPRWYNMGEDLSDLEDAIFNKDTGSGKITVKLENKWAVIVISETRQREVSSLTKMRPAIEKAVRERKERKAVDEWIEELREHARITVHNDVFDALR